MTGPGIYDDEMWPGPVPAEEPIELPKAPEFDRGVVFPPHMIPEEEWLAKLRAWVAKEGHLYRINR